MKKTIFLYPAIFFCLNSNASTDFACSAETPNGVVQISTPSHTSSVVNDFFSTKPHSIRVYVEGNEIDVSQTTIAKKDGWFVVRKDGGKQIVIAFRKVKSQPVSPSADIKYFSSEGKQRIVRAECFDG